MRSRIRYAMLSPRAPRRVAQNIVGGVFVAAAGGLVALFASGAPSHWFAAAVVTVAQASGVAA